jgi:hypothetical protein
MLVMSLHYFPAPKFIYVINSFLALIIYLLAMVYSEMTTKNTVG